MLNEPHVSTANDEVEWLPEPFFQEGHVSGTFRHINCVRVGYVGTFVDGMCSKCSSIDKINTFRCKVWRRAKERSDATNRVRFDYLSHAELCERLRESRKREDQLYHKTFLLSSELRRAVDSKQEFKDKLHEVCSKGNFGEIACNIATTIRKNKITGKEGVLDIMKIISSNLSKNSKGKRYSNCTTTTDFYEAVLLMFGPKACTFVADNLLGPHVHTVMKWRKSKTKPFDFTEPVSVFKMVSSIYKSLKHNLAENGDIPFLFMEDETAIEQRIEYDEKTDSLRVLRSERRTTKCEDHYTFEVRLITRIVKLYTYTTS